MSNIVDKVIYNTLLTDGCVALPELGTLRLEGEPRAVRFEENIDPEAPLLTEVMAKIGGITTEEASALYEDWRIASRESDGAITLEGIGRIQPRTIVMDGSFDKALNHTHDPLPTARLRRRRTDSWLWWVLGIAIAACAALWAVMPWDINAVFIGTFDEVQTEEVAEQEQQSLEMTPTVEPYQEVEVDVKVGVTKPAPALVPENKASVPTTDKRYNLSVGVYSSKQNARDCINRDPLKIGSANYVIGNYPGGKWIVIAHSTNSKKEAETLRSQYKRKGKEVWIYQRY